MDMNYYMEHGHHLDDLIDGMYSEAFPSYPTSIPPMPTCDYDNVSAGNHDPSPPWNNLDLGYPCSNGERLAGRASSNTSNESDSRSCDSLSQRSSPPSTVNGFGTDQHPHHDNEPWSGPQRGAVPSSILPEKTPEAYVCKEGCIKSSFGRIYDLQRHIDEHHRCDLTSCEGMRFSSSKEKKNHEKTHNKGGLGFRCGDCELLGNSPKSLTRLEKLKSHFRDVHGVRDVQELKCDTSPCLWEGRGGIFFATGQSRQEHVRRGHVEDLPAMDTNEKSNGQDHATTICNAISKRPLGQTTVSEPKRWKTSTNVADILESPHVNTTESSIGVAHTPANSSFRLPEISQLTRSDSNLTNHNFDIHAKTNIGARSPITVTLQLSVIELHMLTKQNGLFPHQTPGLGRPCSYQCTGLQSVLTRLTSLHISSTFDCRHASVKLHGSCTEFEMQTGKKWLTDLIEKSKIKSPTTPEEDTLPCSKISKNAQQQQSYHAQQPMLALNPNDDAEVLRVWHEQLLPQFPQIVEESKVKGSYTVALVHHVGPEGKHPVVRFRSSQNQVRTSRKMIRERVKKICEPFSYYFNVHFSQGTIVRLVGGGFPLDDPSSDQKFPHQRRPWKQAGMGASIGLDQCPNTATLGGYILVDGRRYMLSVDHFISQCPCDELHDQLRSPSISDIYDVREQLSKKKEDLDLQYMLLLPDEIPLEEVDMLLSSSELSEEVEQYLRIERELEERDYDFAFGDVHYRCGTGEHPLRKPIDPRYEGELRSMDWSLADVKKTRQGENIHRYRRTSEPGLKDLKGEVLRPKGSGKPCQMAKPVVGGEKAYYIGTASGLREGTINAARTLVNNENGSSYEWSMMTPNCETLPIAAFAGDSGAWILNEENEVLGLLYGWNDGQIMFTPILDVFADIKRSLPCDTVELPSISSDTGNQHGGTTLLCRVSCPQTPKKDLLAIPAFPLDPIKTDLEILSPVGLEDIPERKRSSSTISTGVRSISSVPSLVSVLSASSMLDELCLETPAREGHAMTSLTTAKRSLSSRSLSKELDWQVIHQDDAIFETEEDDEPAWEADLQLRVKPRIRTI
ncbi:hypothetical protein EJ04DRAFT_520116 [Polyplosphaeria fusca]|uniref:C2H2-type domain-containing protein n=1 Tax=Polyplosphaeria fusca TaxID=682080 RepID=A0A9P4V7T7_9PLEO|nr:hypothetical protein EJ04DRAFT_520116 [Polyplosphaeria fusca]